MNDYRISVSNKCFTLISKTALLLARCQCSADVWSNSYTAKLRYNEHFGSTYKCSLYGRFVTWKFVLTDPIVSGVQQCSLYRKVCHIEIRCIDVYLQRPVNYVFDISGCDHSIQRCFSISHNMFSLQTAAVFGMTYMMYRPKQKHWQ